jgi:hypothetical protein
MLASQATPSLGTETPTPNKVTSVLEALSQRLTRVDVCPSILLDDSR